MAIHINLTDNFIVQEHCLGDFVKILIAIFWQNTSSCFQTADWQLAASVGQCQGQAEGICLCSAQCTVHSVHSVHDTRWLSPIAPQAVARRSPCCSHPSPLNRIAIPLLGLVCKKMPFPTRPIQPSSLGRGPPPPGEDPLQWMTNQNLCQAMRQLVSLLKQADSVFGDLEVSGEGFVW